MVRLIWPFVSGSSSVCVSGGYKSLEEGGQDWHFTLHSNFLAKWSNYFCMLNYLPRDYLAYTKLVFWLIHFRYAVYTIRWISNGISPLSHHPICHCTKNHTVYTDLINMNPDVGLYSNVHWEINCAEK